MNENWRYFKRMRTVGNPITFNNFLLIVVGQGVVHVIKQEAHTSEDLPVVIVCVLFQKQRFVAGKRKASVKHQAKIGQICLLPITQNIVEIRIEMNYAVFP